ncbi:chorismate-binding protein [Neisseriaceae bacterium B1]
MTQPFILFDDVCATQAFLLHAFQAQDELLAHDLPQLDSRLKIGWARGWYCALFTDYELGLPLQKLPQRISGSLKILWFTHKKAIADVPQWLAEQGGHAAAGLSRMAWSEKETEYAAKIAAIQAAIARGDTYQINYTLRLRGKAYGAPPRLYACLRQNVPYGALACLPNGDWTLCFSPELFLRIHANGLLSTEPMKGTAPILGDGLDEQRAQDLQNDSKNRAENTMIVDLLRNDLGKLAEIGSVVVPEPFKVAAFGQVWQMTSEVRAQLKPQTSAAAIFQAAFPCGSITGAPKRKSMEWIDLLENLPRGLYTGSIGFLQPENNGIGFSGCLNVAIRTLQLKPNGSTFDAEYGVGSGIVIDSDAASEYAECGWKARFITDLRPECGLFETMRAQNQTIILLPQHLARLAQSAAALNVPFDEQAARKIIETELNQLDKELIYRCKLSLDSSGSLKWESATLTPLQGKQKVLLSDKSLKNQDFLRQHKTTQRAYWDELWQNAVKQDAFDSLAFNENGFLLEGGRSAVKILYENQWLTPHSDLDILNSITREQAIRSGSLKEAYITREMLLNAEKVCLGNALHGWLDVEVCV